MGRTQLTPEQVRDEAVTMSMALVGMRISCSSAIEMLGYASGLMIGTVASEDMESAIGLLDDFERGKRAGLEEARRAKAG